MEGEEASVTPLRVVVSKKASRQAEGLPEAVGQHPILPTGPASANISKQPVVLATQTIIPSHPEERVHLSSPQY